MATSAYPINRGINKPISFRGLKAQYILYAGALLAGDMVLFSVLYICGLNSWIGVVITGCAGGGGTWKIYKLSQQYGEFGLLKKRAGKRIPPVIRSRSRTTFTQLIKNHEKDIA